MPCSRSLRGDAWSSAVSGPGGLLLGGEVPGLGGLCSWGVSQGPHPRGKLMGSGPGPHPRGKLRGIRSRPTLKGEIEGDQIQAHTQRGN